MALIPFKSTEKQGKANSKSILSPSNKKINNVYRYFKKQLSILLQSLMALIPFKSTEKQGKANSKSILSLALLMFSLVAWMCLFR